MPSTTARVLFVLLLAAFCSPELAAQGPEPGFYQLHPDSSALVGCLDLCDCLIREVPDLEGSFSLDVIDVGATFTLFAVEDMVLLLGTDPPVTVQASGSLEARITDGSVYETFELQVAVGDEEPELFRSEPRLREEAPNEVGARVRPAALVCEGQIFLIRALQSEEVPFVRGDCNADGSINVSDAITLLLRLFGGGEAPPCETACDVNGDIKVDIADATAILGFLFTAGPTPVAPFPTCGIRCFPG